MKREEDEGVDKKSWRLERPEKVEEEREWSELKPRSERAIVVKEELRL